MSKPVVGITLGDGSDPGVHAIRQDYLRSVEGAGAVPLLLAPVAPQDVPHLLDRVDGVLLSGGGDLDPAFYGQAPHEKLGRVSRARDEFELALTREALRRDLPILAICRGHQVLNVALGGTLLQHIASDLRGATEHDAPGERWRLVHEVELLPRTRLREIVGRERVSVNSSHHQALDRIADGLAVSARCPTDGVVEGLELPRARFVLAVQWHPEVFWSRPDPFQALFSAHSEACRR